MDANGISRIYIPTDQRVQVRRVIQRMGKKAYGAEINALVHDWHARRIAWLAEDDAQRKAQNYEKRLGGEQ